jgi:type IV pilus assembly protein PilP
MVKKQIQKPEEKSTTPLKPAGVEREQPAAKAPAEAPAMEKPRIEAKPPEAPQAPAAPPSPLTTQPAGYVYDPKDRPDPFRPFFEEARTGTEALSECEGVAPGPLTEQEPSQFTLVAVLGQGPEVVGMVQDRTRKGYVLRLGTFVGKKCGKVVEITPEGVVIEEPYRDLLGQRKTRKVALEFKKAEGGGR